MQIPGNLTSYNAKPKHTFVIYKIQLANMSFITLLSKQMLEYQAISLVENILVNFKKEHVNPYLSIVKVHPSIFCGNLQSKRPGLPIKT